MRQAVAYCEWKSRWWLELAGRVPERPHSAHDEGLRAYAFAHADAEQRLGQLWARKWLPLMEMADKFMQDFPMLPLYRSVEVQDANGAVAAPNDGDAAAAADEDAPMDPAAHENDAAAQMRQDDAILPGNEDHAPIDRRQNPHEANNRGPQRNPDVAAPAAPVLPDPPVIELELEEDDEYADDYFFHADDFY